MVILSLDANVAIDVMRGRLAAVRDRWENAVLSDARLMVSTLVLHELRAGVSLSAQPASQGRRLEAFMAEASVVDFEAGDAVAAGEVRAALQRVGRPIGLIDTLIAGQALARGWTVVTGNVRHFGRVEGLPIIDWSVGSDVLSRNQIAARIEAEV